MEQPLRVSVAGAVFCMAVCGCTGGQVTTESDTHGPETCPEPGFADIDGDTPFGFFQGTAAWYSAVYPLECSGAHGLYIVANANAFQEGVMGGFEGVPEGGYVQASLAAVVSSGPGVFDVPFLLYYDDDNYTFGRATLTLTAFDAFPDADDGGVMIGEFVSEDPEVLLHGSFAAPFCSALADSCI